MTCGFDLWRAAQFAIAAELIRITLLPSLLPRQAKAVGSRFLGDRVRQLRPDVHVFGHTHFAWDAHHDGGCAFSIIFWRFVLSRPTGVATRTARPWVLLTLAALFALRA